MLLSLPRIISLVLSSAVLVCFAVIFSACTSPTSVNVIGIRNPEHLNELRSLAIHSGQNSSSSLEIVYLSDRLSEAVSDAVDHITGHVEDQPSHMQYLLPIYYVIGLQSYCEGKPTDKALSNCSKPSAHFSFDPIDVLGTWLGPADGGTTTFAQWIIGAYITGFVQFPMTEVAVLISSSVPSLLIIGASVSVTILYQLLAKGIDRLLQHEITANLGPHAMAATWLAVAFSAGSSLVLAIAICSCCL
ncbi:hypothetical protein BDQ94DRAFT_164659 [Aspergillus welwitschiae]|uniref:Actin cortical patch SUR7/pH-response regulator pali n=1 Tax=Aspergillus welwitschiae TaxID=1341132 RepID=A0A3F3PIQ5_9EURO|nr:hypothetical protein BDQ94DRAFT_164659 [Aspergillus welwitschiae]RDH26226.1 hypothetical protein BDQ94DRAFT_164659 [Aspergillus welwitschiae]